MVSEPPSTNGTGSLPKPSSPNPLRRVIRHFERTLGAGILVMLPIGITLLVLKFIFDSLNPILEPTIARLPGPDIPGAGLIGLLIIIYAAGLIAAFVLGRRLIAVGHRILEVIPVVKGIYSTTRSAVQLLSHDGAANQRYSGVVLIEFPRPGMRSIGLVTSRLRDLDGEEIFSIYIPTTPIPSSGFLVMVPASEVTMTDMSVEDAMSVVISGGILSERIFERAGVGFPGDISSDE